MSKIKVMDEILANKIAAGEVVERCASVVKELVENSIDAKSTSIKIELKESGVELIKVTDNGVGMDRDDAILSFSRHATSKISDEDDLFRINTLGFRGEALASIASVSNVELVTSDGVTGTTVNIKGGKIIDVKSSDLRKGTSISITQLFYNTPARLKHMKSLYTELASIVEYVNKMALSHSDVRFTLINNGNTLLNTDGTNNTLKVIASIYGIDVAKKMYKVECSDDDYDITGYISYPEVNRSSRNHMVTLVNGRVVKNVELNRTINDGYHSYKPDNRYPIVVLLISVDPSLIDVNIHPTKMDIKFSKLEELLALVLKMIKDKLKNQSLIRDAYIEEFDNEKLVLNDTFTVADTKEEYNVDYDKFESDKILENNEISNEEVLETQKKYEEITLNLERNEAKEEIYKEDSTKRLPEMYPVGLVHGTYIICQNELGMYMIDEHAAKERVNYELFKEKLTNPSNKSIPLLIPITMEYSNDEYIVLKENFDYLRNLGFEIEEFGINSVIIKSHPVWLTKDFIDLQIKKILELVISKEKDFTLDKFNDHLAATLACKASIKANTNISISEMENLINDLRKCKNPFNCPHGRPTIIYYSKYDLEKLFKRSGFESLK